MILLLTYAVMVVILGAVFIASILFARRRRREGSWTADGPINPSPVPPDWNRLPGYVPNRPTIETEFEEDGLPIDM